MRSVAKAPFAEEQLRILHDTVEKQGFTELVSPDRAPASELLGQIAASPDFVSLNRVLGSTSFDLAVPTDSRPFFFNQLRVLDFPGLLTVVRGGLSGRITAGTVIGNLAASAVLFLILFISIVAVVAAILVPLRGAARECPRSLAIAGSLYFSLIGMGFMLAEIGLLEYFSVYLGHPIYSLGVGLFSLILASGLGSLTSDWLKLNSRGRLVVWGSIIAAYLTAMVWVLPSVFHATTGQDRLVRIGVSLAAIMPLGLLLGFAFPTGMRLASAIDT
jgi:hypothetical protein